MSIQSEITRISKNVNDTLAAIAQKGGTVPASATSDDMSEAVKTISVMPPNASGVSF